MIGANAREAMERATPRRPRVDPDDGAALTRGQKKELWRAIEGDTARVIAIDLLQLAKRFRRYGWPLNEPTELLARMIGRPLEVLQECACLVLPVVEKLADDDRLLALQRERAGKKGGHQRWAKHYRSQAAAPSLPPGQRRDLERKVSGAIEEAYKAAWAKHEADCDRNALWDKPPPEPPEKPREQVRYSAEKWARERLQGMAATIGQPELAAQVAAPVRKKLAEMLLRLGGGQGGVEGLDIQAALYLSEAHFLSEWVAMRWGEPRTT